MDPSGRFQMMEFLLMDSGQDLPQGRDQCRTFLAGTDGDAQELRENEDVKEFYLGIGGGHRMSFRDVKSYKRRKRWLA